MAKRKSARKTAKKAKGKAKTRVRAKAKVRAKPRKKTGGARRKSTRAQRTEPGGLLATVIGAAEDAAALRQRLAGPNTFED